MKDNKSSNSNKDIIKVFNGELFVNTNQNDIDYEVNNNSLRKSTSYSNGGSMSNNIRESMKSSHSNNERFLTRSLIRDLRGSTKKLSDKKLEFDRLRLKEKQNKNNDSQLSDNNNSNIIEEDYLANIKLQKNDNNQLNAIEDDDLYEDVEVVESEEDKCEEKEIRSNKNEEMNDTININELARLNENLSKSLKNTNKKIEHKENELEDALSFRSSTGSECISTHSNNPNNNLNMNMRSSSIFNNKNMRSSNIFNKNKINCSDQNNNDSNKNLIQLYEGISSENENNIIKNEVIENKDYLKKDLDKKENERKEKLSKIKDLNSEENFFRNSVNLGNKNINISINNVEEDSSMLLEMQLFNLDSLNSEKEKEKEVELNKKNIYPDFTNIKQSFEDTNNEIIPKIINIKKEEEKLNDSFKGKEEEISKEINDKKEKLDIIDEPKKEMKKEEYIFEKFGKLGWECIKCNNFNFESRTICNRCEAPKQPKSLEQIKLENEQKSGEKKKKTLIERKGDWQCPLCHNLNFAFRVTCNRCKLPKEMYLNLTIKQQKINENRNNNINNQNNFIPKIPKNQIINNNGPKLINNQFNIIQMGYLPIYKPFFSPNNFCQVPQSNNNMNNYKRKYKFYKQ